MVRVRSYVSWYGHLDHATRQLTSPPWKCLNWKTLHRVLAEELLHLIWHAADSR